MKMKIEVKIKMKGKKKEFSLPLPMDEENEETSSSKERSHDLFMRSRDLFFALKKGEVIRPSKDELEELKKNLEFFVDNEIRRSQEISVEDDINRKAKEYFGGLYKERSY